ncbi:S-adenosylmethionine tRNA ribosyltransferase [Corallococcus praedator]|uniref:S-adenosylmethionine tRNA ribosyltransferase n=1 Tax=Corallococcus praedator TaxID=2316724 RepID=A0ABX9QHS1_9BACT|nr:MULTISPECIES: S-adenosylmethionine:tRNA ribosyltransferase-isomerase [Corallococcus]RKH19688.1 S-adenosylmethionine tRNA ribosyltransferase [Corallococcus sp. CA047B]RKH26323.1 S-adenosylmethionine tRNA ribosyltransferase [Corallococcus sp. CA031C]RKI06135.1 S-adenosylmethionine tRNA ribosyltransferase [Corallococcus praedator]
MNAARWPREHPDAARLLHVEPRAGRLSDGIAAGLPDLLREGDLLVLNDAATLPGSLTGRTGAGAPIELRLLAHEPDDTWTAVLFGAGDWRRRTEDRLPPPELPVGAHLEVGGLKARVVEVLPPSPRLVRVAFDLSGAALWHALYQAGRPVQYSHTAGPLALWHVQTLYAARPWAAEMPSAGLPLTASVFSRLKARGVRWASLTHAAGLSSTGDAVLDAALPRPERSDIPARTVEWVEETRAQGGRVVAVGTTVVRALEGRATQHGGRLVAGEDVTDLLLGPGYVLRVVHGLLTGVHEPGSSHHALLQAFAPLPLLQRAAAHAEAAGYLGHEFGDTCLVLDA